MEDCYFIISPNQTVQCICIDCNKEEQGFYWQGSVMGYGINEEVICCKCNKILYQSSLEDTSENKEDNDSESNI